MIIRAEIITYRVDSGVALAAFLQSGDSIADVSQHTANSLPDPDSVVWALVGSEETLAAVEADDDHFVLWSEGMPNEGI